MKFRVIGIYYLDSEEHIFVGKMDKYDQYELILFRYRRQTWPDIYHLWFNKYDVNTILYQLLIAKLSPLSYGGMGGSREEGPPPQTPEYAPTPHNYL